MHEQIHVYGHDADDAYLHVGYGDRCVAIAPSRRLERDMPTASIVLTSEEARHLGTLLITRAALADHLATEDES